MNQWRLLLLMGILMVAGWAGYPGLSNGDAGLQASLVNQSSTSNSPTTNSMAVLDRGDGASAGAYEVIVRRNVFGLQPVPPPAVEPVMEPPPNEDLLLTGLCDLSCARTAFFSVVEPGHAANGFVLAEGEQNEWLELLAVDTAGGTAKVRLKKPVVRVRSVGVEVVLSLEKAR